MSFKTVGEIMVPLDRYPHLPGWFTLRQALAELTSAQSEAGQDEIDTPRSALVFDTAYRLLGEVRHRDIMRGIMPPRHAWKELQPRGAGGSLPHDRDRSKSWFDETVEKIQKRSEREVNEVMQPIDTTLDVDDTLMKAVSVFIEHDIWLIPVLKGGRVAGVVSTQCVSRELAEYVL